MLDQQRQNFQRVWLNFIFMMVAMFAIFYFLLIRPQQKKAKQHQEMLKALKRGDSVITNGGIAGTVVGTTEKYLTVEIAEKVRIRVLRSERRPGVIRPRYDSAVHSPYSPSRTNFSSARG